MTFSAADMGIKTGALGLFTIGRHLHPPLETRFERSGHPAAQAHELASIGKFN